TTVAYNQRRKQPNTRYFQFGKTDFKTEEGYQERKNLGLCMAGHQVEEHWTVKSNKTNFYHLKAAVDAIVKRLNIPGLQLQETDSTYFVYGLNYMKGQKVLVTLGAVSA